MTRPSSLLSTTALVALAGAAALRTLQWVGRRLDRPERTSPSEIGAWFGSVEPVTAGATVLWSVAVVATIWLLVAVVLQLLAAIASAPVLRMVADAISPRSLQRLGHGLAALSLSAGLAAAPGAGLLAGPPRAPSEGIVAGAGDGPADPSWPGDAAPPGTATMTRLDTDRDPAPSTVLPNTTVPPTTTSTGVAPASTAPLADSSTTVTTRRPPPPTTLPVSTTEPAQSGGVGERGAGRTSPGSVEVPTARPAEPVVVGVEHPGTAPVEGAPPEVGAADTIVVEPGMSFWSIAEEVVTERLGSADERALHRYWQALMAANRNRLVVPGNADLLLPGQELVLPAG